MMRTLVVFCNSLYDKVQVTSERDMLEFARLN
jgi:hypothetical protein